MATKTNKSVMGLVGRAQELRRIRACVAVGKNVLLEGPVGVGKTCLALAVTQELKRPVFRVDGDQRFSEQKMTGWFDPPSVLKKGYSKDAFMPGPLVEAMKTGGVLFINELNRLPEGVQNVLLPAIDEQFISVPRLGEIHAKSGFLVIATQNPKEFVATSHLSEAILDRFELVRMEYASEEDERLIVASQSDLSGGDRVIRASVALTRLTRSHPRVRRGASVRAAISIAELTQQLMLKKSEKLETAFYEAVLMALPTRIEIERESELPGGVHEEMEALFQEWVQAALESSSSSDSKKKS